MKRRSFLKATGGVVGGYALGLESVRAAEKALAEKKGEKKAEEVAGMPRRVLGRTGEKVSIVAFPGFSLVHCDQQESNAAVRKAFDRGVNYFDVAPAYGDSQEKLGPALEQIGRDHVFLSCKTKMRDKEGALKELEQSLKVLKTDHFDLYQMHHIRKPEDIRQALAPGGAIETFLKAREEGKVRFFGFSAHTTKGALEGLKGFSFDTVMFPINFIEHFKIGFGDVVLEEAGRKGAAVIAIKPMCGGTWPKDAERTRKWWYRPLEDPREIQLALRFTLSRPNVATGVPPGWVDLVDKAIEGVADYRPLTEAEMQELRKIAEPCGSVFQAQEEAVARGIPLREPLYADSAHECGPYSLA